MYFSTSLRSNSGVISDCLSNLLMLHREVTLNGKLLKLADDTIPPLEPLQQEASSVLTLPPLSFGFYVFKDVQASACI